MISSLSPPQVLEPSDKYLIAPLNKTHYTLTITNFNEDDVGEYSASATNSISTDSQTVVVNVESKFTFTISLFHYFIF